MTSSHSAPPARRKSTCRQGVCDRLHREINGSGIAFWQLIDHGLEEGVCLISMRWPAAQAVGARPAVYEISEPGGQHVLSIAGHHIGQFWALRTP